MLEFALAGPEGNNPLGFLTALGALVTLEDAGHGALLGWIGVRPRLLVKCNSEIGAPEGDEARRMFLVRVLFEKLHREPGDEASKTQAAKKEMERAKTALKKKREAIEERKLDSSQAKEARRIELEPLEKDRRDKTAEFKRLLCATAVDPSVSLGENLTETNVDLIAHFAISCERSAHADRRWVDIAASYGVADPGKPADRMRASPWALIGGSGHQDFLSSVEELMLGCTENHVRQALFGPWDPQDGKYSLRLDSADDRRYALMDRDPTDGDNKPRTLWGANRMAFEALRFFPAMPVHGGMGVRSWQATGDNWLDGCRVRWPLWSPPVAVPVVHSLLGLPSLWEEEISARNRLRGLGIHAVMESRRIAVGAGANKKFNLTPATPVWADQKQPGAP